MSAPNESIPPTGQAPVAGGGPGSSLSRRRLIQAGIGGLAALGLSGTFLSACGGGDDDSSSTTAPRTGGTKKVKIGVIGPFSGPGAFIGRIINKSFNAGLDEIERIGGIGGFVPELLIRDAGLEAANGVKAYQEFAGDDDVIGVLWCGAPGLQEALGQIARDNLPVIAVFNDVQTLGLLYPKGAARSVFQMIQADEQAIDLLADYAANDRGYTRAAMIYDTVLEEGSNKAFEKSCAQYGIENVGVEQFKFGDSDFGPQVQRLKRSGCHAVFIWGLAPETALIAKAIDAVGGAYVDSATAKKASPWAPHIMGSPGGTAEKTWVKLAGKSARPGTLSTWHVGGLVSNPSFPIRDWVKKYLDEDVTGGEDSPLNGLAMLLQAADQAGSTKREAIIEALESGAEFKFASPVGYSFTKDRHLALEKDDMLLVSLERPPEDPPYTLGKEFEEVFEPGYEGPTHFVDFTLEANRRKHPEVIEEVLDRGYGTYCGADRQADAAAVDACRAIH